MELPSVIHSAAPQRQLFQHLSCLQRCDNRFNTADPAIPENNLSRNILRYVMLVGHQEDCQSGAMVKSVGV